MLQQSIALPASAATTGAFTRAYLASIDLMKILADSSPGTLQQVLQPKNTEHVPCGTNASA
jgi:hypothetical protein